MLGVRAPDAGRARVQWSNSANGMKRRRRWGAGQQRAKGGAAAAGAARACRDAGVLSAPVRAKPAPAGGRAGFSSCRALCRPLPCAQPHGSTSEGSGLWPWRGRSAAQASSAAPTCTSMSISVKGPSEAFPRARRFLRPAPKRTHTQQAQPGVSTWGFWPRLGASCHAHYHVCMCMQACTHTRSHRHAHLALAQSAAYFPLGP